MRRTQEDTAKTVEKILDSALLVFNQYGYHAAKLDDIAKDAGMTRGPISWHFKNKANLFKAVLERSAKNFKQGIEAAFDNQFTPIERINNYIDFLFLDSNKLRNELNLINPLLASSDEQSHLNETKKPISEALGFLMKSLQETITIGLEINDFNSSIELEFLSKSIYAYSYGLLAYPIADYEEMNSLEERENIKNTISKILEYKN